jgi:hypothetical protein
MHEHKRNEGSIARPDATPIDSLYVHNKAQAILMTAWIKKGGNPIEWAEQYGARFSSLEEHQPNLVQSLVDGTIPAEQFQQRLETIH